MRAIESWQTNRQVATSIQRIPVLIAAPLAAGAAPERAFCGEAIGAPGESATVGTVPVMQCSKGWLKRMAQKNDFETGGPMR